MRRPREAVHAAMLAASIRVDGAVEGDVRRFVAGDDRARPLDLHFSFEGRQLLDRLPSIVEDLTRCRLVPAGRVDRRTPAATAVEADADAALLDDGIGHVRASMLE